MWQSLTEETKKYYLNFIEWNLFDTIEFGFLFFNLSLYFFFTHSVYRSIYENGCNLPYKKFCIYTKETKKKIFQRWTSPKKYENKWRLWNFTCILVHTEKWKTFPFWTLLSRLNHLISPTKEEKENEQELSEKQQQTKHLLLHKKRYLN